MPTKAGQGRTTANYPDQGASLEDLDKEKMGTHTLRHPIAKHLL
jgi:hypothetical protein